MTQPFKEQFEALRKKYFVPLCDALGLADDRHDVRSTYASASVGAGHVRVFFECDRGIGEFGVGELAAESPVSSVEALAERFPRVGLMPEGSQRLGLDEQASFIASHWQDLQVMFSPAHIRETKAWRDAASKAHMQKYTRDT
jgi:hypothetical protein